MKRSCKQVDIENWQVIFPWVYDCISRHKRKKDFRRLSSYKGYFYPNRRKCRKRHIRLNLKTRKVDKKYKLAAVFAKAAAVVSRYERRKHYEDTVYKQTGSNPVYAFA